MADFVVDNSVVMRWCFARGAHPYADAVLRQLSEADATAFVPVLWPYEASNVLAQAERRGAIAADMAAEFVELIEGLPIAMDGEGTARVLGDVRRVAVSYGLSSYDAAYLELAQRLQLPLATLDDGLIRASRAARVAIFEAL